MAHPTPPSEQPLTAPQHLEGAEIIFIVGPPGAGKGTQCAPLAQNLGILHYSAGDLLRQEQKERSSWWRGDWIAAHRADRTGVPVPHEVYLEILRDRIYQDIKSGRKMFLIDGFPRNVEHDRLFAKYHPNVKAMISFECSIEASVQRVVHRGKSSGRSEDHEEMAAQRYRRFQQSSAPLLREFEDRGLLNRVDCNRSQQEVYAEVERLVKETFRMP